LNKLARKSALTSKHEILGGYTSQIRLIQLKKI